MDNERQVDDIECYWSSVMLPLGGQKSVFHIQNLCDEASKGQAIFLLFFFRTT